MSNKSNYCATRRFWKQIFTQEIMGTSVLFVSSSDCAEIIKYEQVWEFLASLGGRTMLLSLKDVLCCFVFAVTWWSKLLDTFQTLLFEWEMLPKCYFFSIIFVLLLNNISLSHSKCRKIIWCNTYMYIAFKTSVANEPDVLFILQYVISSPGWERNYRRKSTLDA